MFPESEEDDENELTSIMSAEERSLLQESTRRVDEQRPTARPHKAAEPVDGAPATASAEASAAVVIPKAPPVPGDAVVRSKPQAGAPSSASGAAPDQASARAPAQRGGLSMGTALPFLLLAAAVAFAMLRG